MDEGGGVRPPGELPPLPVLVGGAGDGDGAAALLLLPVAGARDQKDGQPASPSTAAARVKTAGQVEASEVEAPPAVGDREVAVGPQRAST